MRDHSVGPVREFLCRQPSQNKFVIWVMCFLRGGPNETLKILLRPKVLFLNTIMCMLSTDDDIAGFRRTEVPPLIGIGIFKDSLLRLLNYMD